MSNTINLITKTTSLAKEIWKSYLHDDCLAIDATVGNGNDTLFLCQNCRFVYGFDIQKEAIDNTRDLLRNKGLNNFEFFERSHAEMDLCVKEKADLIVFNLGYLPDGIKTVTTETETTLKAVEKALTLLKKDGLLSIMMYWGHEEGKREREALLRYAAELDGREFHCVYLNTVNQSNNPPEILLITRKRKQNEKEKR